LIAKASFIEDLYEITNVDLILNKENNMGVDDLYPEETVAIKKPKQKRVSEIDHDTYKKLINIRGEVDHLKLLIGIETNERRTDPIEPICLMENADANNILAIDILADLLKITEVL
jgi:hypothetical protein